jgi:UDP-N-acetylglucosamine 1-carboxyvinyltransferase
LDKLLLKGGNPLRGQVRISGAKNSTLPIMAASLMSAGEVILNGVPDLEDVRVMSQALKILGAKVKREGTTLCIDSSQVNKNELPEEISRKLRASNLIMGALLGRFKQARVSFPGGCAIGSRPLDLHLKGFNNIGYKTSTERGFMEGSYVRAGGGEIVLDFPSVGATENIMMAAALNNGTTIIRNAAREPEIVDLQNFLNRMGAIVKGAGLDTIRIEGVKKLDSVEHTVIPDRIEAGTFMIAAAISKGDIWIENMIPEHLLSLTAKLKEIGVEVLPYARGCRIIGHKNYRATDIKTMPYPGFPTDMQPQMMALLLTANGTSVIVETIFENRFMHVGELRRLGAEIKIEGKVAIINGARDYEGSFVEATDLRAGAALVLAGLVARGQTEIGGLQHLDRGYDKFHEKMQGLGAAIKRVAML